MWRAIVFNRRQAPLAAAADTSQRDSVAFEHSGVIMPGDIKRPAVNGVVAALGAAKEAGVATTDYVAHVTAVNKEDGRVVRLPSTLVAGLRCELDPEAKASLASDQILHAVVAIGAKNVLPSPQNLLPIGSLQVFISLAFVGPGNAWVPGASLQLAAYLEAAAAWSSSSVSDK